MPRPFGTLAIVVSIVGFTACSAPAAGSAQTVRVDLGEYGVAPSPATVRAGRITFAVRNNGQEDHEVEIANRAGRDVPDSAILDEVEDLGPGESKSFTVDLRPGTYELACRLVDTKANPPFNHYDRGMYVAFVVQ